MRRMRQSHRAWSSWLLVVAIAVVPACTSNGESASGSAGTSEATSTGSATGTPPADAPPPAPPLTVLWTDTEFRPLGQPVAAGSGVVLYTETNTVAYITVLDGATGAVRWRRPASVGGEAPGVTLNPAVVAGTVVYLQPDEFYPAMGNVVVADAMTGVAAFTSELYDISERPRECAGHVCFRAWVNGVVTALTMDIGTGAVTPDPDAAIGDSRRIGTAGLESITEPDKPERIARQGAVGANWDRPMSDVFGAGYSSDFGWSFRYFADINVFVGAVGYDPKGTDANAIGRSRKLWGIDGATGAVLWSADGAENWCLVDAAGASDDDALHAIRCQWGAAATVGADHKLGSGAVSIQGFDPATGRPTWTVPLADQTGHNGDTWRTGIRRGFGGRLMAPGADGTLAIDPRTGAAGAVGSEQVLCTTDIETPIWGGSRIFDGKPYNNYRTGAARDSCRADGARVATSTTWPAGVGAVIGDVSVVTTPDGLQAFTARPGATPVAGESAPVASVPAASVPAASVPVESVPGTSVPVAPAWVGAGFRAVGQPVAAGSVALVYGEIDGRLNLIAVDPAGGGISWTQQVSGGQSSAAAHAVPAIVGNRVVYLTRAAGQSSRLTISDVATGAVLSAGTHDFTVTAPLRVCGADVCFGYSDASSHSGRIDVLTGLVAGEPPGDGSSSMPLGAGLRQLGAADGTQRIVVSNRDEVVFEVPYSAIVPDSFTTFDSSIEHRPGVGVYIIELGDTFDFANPSNIVDYGHRATIEAVDDITGAVRWISTGTDRHCLPWLIRGQLASGSSVRCHWGPDARAAYADGGWVYSGMSLTLEGFDPATGQTTWAVPLADQSGPDSAPPGDLLDASHLLMQGPTGPLSVSLLDGSTAPAEPPTRLCTTPISAHTGYQVTMRSLDGTTAVNDVWDTGDTIDWCDAAGRPVPAATWPAWAGVQIGDLRLVTTAQGLSGYRQSG